ncbi:hypothetical protein B9T07_22955 [Limnospira fusiformis CCALA 023]|uniref:hypothetical protein n=1 Tax=Oscillatoriales TaxID=1150 RepID=UPI00396DA200
MQIIDVEQVEATTEKLKQSHQQPEAQPKRFDAIADRDLMRLGVPEILLPAVREIVSDRMGGRTFAPSPQGSQRRDFYVSCWLSPPGYFPTIALARTQR